MDSALQFDRTSLLQSASLLSDPTSMDRLVSQGRSLLIIDSGVADAQVLVAGAAVGTAVYQLRAGIDAVEQITALLAGERDVASLQIVSHGRSGGLNLGAGWLDLQSMPSYLGQLKSWGQALTAEADILLYGCDVGQGESGKVFVNLLAEVTGADVAASDDLTGNGFGGGDWDLEVRAGVIEAGGLVVDNYRGVLASFGGSTNVGVGAEPMSVALGDVNGDGKLDLLTANRSSNNVSVRLGDGLGGFSGTTNFAVGDSPRSVTLGDVNRDGKLDFLTANQSSDNVSVRLGDGLGGFSATTDVAANANPVSVTLGDVNGDGKLDLLIANPDSNLNGTVSVRLGDGLGGFTGTINVPGVNPASVTLGDVNGDGKLDLLTANLGLNNVSVRLGDGMGGFTGSTNVGVGTSPYSVTLGDVNGDGKLDFLVANGGSNNVSVRLGDGLGGFSGSTNIPVGTFPQSVTLGDVNGDGKLDFLAANFSTGTVSVSLGDGLGGFSGTSNVAAGSNLRSVVLGDVNGDGKLDLLAANSANISVRLNTTPKVTVSAGTAPVEGGINGSFTISLDNPAPVGGLVVNYNLSGTAIAGSDYTLNQAASTNITAIAPGSFTIAAGQTTATIAVIAIADGIVDAGETIGLNILSGDYFRDSSLPRFIAAIIPEIGVGAVPYSVTLGDVNRDGKLDLLSANAISNNVSVRLGDGLGGFTGSTEIGVGANPRSVTLGDVNRDGKLDLLSANFGSNDVSVRLGDGLGGFSGSTNIGVGTNPESVTLGDVNGDGKLDLLTTNVGSSNVSVRLGDGLGGFSGSTNIAVGVNPYSVTLGDVNGDGKLDLITASNNGSNTVSVGLGDGLGGFTGNTNIAVGAGPYSVILGDVNGDGKFDLLTTNVGSNDVSVRLGNGLGGFTGNTNIAVGTTPISMTSGDVNGDGKLDFLTANYGSGNVSVRLGDGLGGFTGNTDVGVGAGPHSVTLGDVNGDGKLDLITANLSSNTVSVRLSQPGADLVIGAPINTAPILTLPVSGLSGPIIDINPGTPTSSPQKLVDVNGIVYFTANNGTSGAELWKSDGTSAGTVLVKDISTGTSSSYPYALTNVNGTLYFVADNATNGSELWKSDGTTAGTVLVKDINPGPLASVLREFTNVNGILYFTANDNLTGDELWKSDGTAAGTVLVKDIRTGTISTSPQNLTNVNGTLYFTTNDGLTGDELWKSDGTAAGTVLVKDINSGTGSSFPYALTNANGTLYFGATDPTNGAELWKSDGTAAGTTLVKDIIPGTGSAVPNNLTNINGILYFTTDDKLWKTDGTPAGTVLVKDITLGVGNAFPGSLTKVNNTLYFTAYTSTNGQELWKSDGTPAGTVLVKDINPGTGSSDADNLIDVNGTLYFNANDGTNGVELWKSDGTAAGTVLVKDLFPGASPNPIFGGTIPNSSGPRNLTNANGKLFFSADNGTIGNELWAIDPNPSISYLENTPPILVDINGTISDADSPDFNTGTMTVGFSLGGIAVDRLSIRNQGTSPTQINVTGSNIFYGTTQIGTFTGGTGTTNLVITFNASATPVIAQALLRNITYANTSQDPNPTQRTISFVLTDGDGGTSMAVTKQINVIPNVAQADLLLRQRATGEMRILGLSKNQVVVDESTQFANGTAYSPGLDWQFVSGKSDFNGDGIRDFVWFNTVTGESAIWYMQNGSTGLGNIIGLNSSFVMLPGAQSAFQVGAGWQLAAVEDLLGNGRSEFLWYNPTAGTTAIWELNIGSNGRADINLSTSAFITLNNAPVQIGTNSAWKIVGVGNFDGDLSTKDILWFNKNLVELAVWQMNGTAIAGSGYLNAQGSTLHPSGWRPVSIGNIDGTGPDEIVLMSGLKVAIWNLGSNFEVTNRSVILSQQLLPVELVQGLADLNFDGTLDLVARQTFSSPGGIQIYYLNSATFQLSTPTPRQFLVQPPAITPYLIDRNWDIVGTADFGGPLVTP